MKKTLFILLVCLVPILAKASEVDSLLNLLEGKSEQNQVMIYAEICHFLKNTNPVKAVEYGKKGLEQAKKIKYKEGIASCLNHIGICYKNQGEYKKAIEVYEVALVIFSELDDSLKIGSVYNNLGAVYGGMGDINKGLEYYLKSLQIEERMGNSSRLGGGYNNVGTMYKEVGNYTMAIEFYQKGIANLQEYGDTSDSGIPMMNMGQAYYLLHNYDTAVHIYNASLAIFKKYNNKRFEAMTYTNLALVYDIQTISDKAIEYNKLSYKINEEIGDKTGMAYAIINTGFVYYNEQDFDKALEYFGKGLEISKSINANYLVREVYKKLADCYSEKKQFEKAYSFELLYTSLKDSMLNEYNSSQFLEMQTKYETAQKEQEIARQQLEIERQEAEVKQQTTLKYAFIGGLFFFVIIAMVIFRNYRIKKKANVILSIRNVEISQQKEEISTQRDNLEVLNKELEQKNVEISAQRNEIEAQKEKVEEMHGDLKDSILYARRIQCAMLTDLTTVFTGEKKQAANNKQIATLPSVVGNAGIEYFLLFKPKDVVSGDFYWATKINNWMVMTVADCTGHGVPGAFMSMLGISSLNDIVRKKEVTKASQVLNELRKTIIESLQQTGSEGSSQDGMDMALCAYNEESRELQYAGANNPLIVIHNLITKEERLKQSGYQETDYFPIAHNDGVIVEVKADKMPIAIYLKNDDFTNHHLLVEKGDIIYLFSDGYQDQFGGEKGKKFKYNPFKSLLLQHHHLPMSEQCEILDTTLKQWKGELEQVDDVCVMGVRFG